jgi:GntR family transcriptional regulator
LGSAVSSPLYRQIADDLREQIDVGSLAPGQQLPTESEFQEKYNASRNTIRDAIKWLSNLGLVETRPGQGTFVVQRIDPFTTVLSDDISDLDVFVSKTQSSSGRNLQVIEPRVEIQRSEYELAMQLGITVGKPVISRQQELKIDGIPWALQTTFYSLELVNQGAFRLIETVNLTDGDLAYLREATGVIQKSYCDLIMARSANADEVSFFNLPGGYSQLNVFEIKRTAYDDAGRPIRLAVTIYPVDRNKFIYQGGPRPAVSNIQQTTDIPDDSHLNSGHDG